ncbi:uncharacterized protein F4812DRAFT_444828 [Daldinia caldariorum]|uniref:uncharacterized protein n=1 Tax=Daldinia caldariorum TaxID=326644 RepID=UPI0020089B99|nr:uncharacterized protein F4812DRAFT_444828 [Daldinia caldariorum]KAI1463883.1 hypothetical protein F4812DRAFT_444828 [Daldinia caldariorum]
MAPPPATPTPRRFLVPRRSQPRNETPQAYQSGGGHQFQATPRFSLYSTPRGPGVRGENSSLRPPSSIATPAPASASGKTGAGTYYRPTPRTTDPINDAIDSSPPSLDEQQQSGEGGGNNYHDPIEAFDVDTDVDAVLESSPVREPNNIYDESSDGGGDIKIRSPKRRRISISSALSSNTHDSPQREDGYDSDTNDNYHDHDNDNGNGNSKIKIEDEDEDEDTIMLDNFDPSSPLSHDLTTDRGGTPEPTLPRPSTSAQQPVFHKAPRFKPVESPEAGPFRGDPLPDAFSPHRRRGAKYIPGGLADSVRDWFVDVWAGATTVGVGARRDGEGEGGWIARILVDGVQGSAGMTLVTGRRVTGEEDGGLNTAEEKDGWESDGTGRNARIVLAGSQKVVGLEKGLEVRPGSVVGVGGPSWEVVVPGQGRWGVVCEWAVLR